MSSTVNVGTLEGLLRWKVDKSEVDKGMADIAKQANISRGELSGYLKELVSIETTYKKVAASIDPAIAAEQKYEKAHKALSNALKIGLIDHEKYNALLSQAKTKYSETESPLKSLIESVVKLTGSLGPAGAGAHEAAEGLGALAGKAGSLGEMIAGLGPLLPIVIGLAAALAAVGVAFEAFEFIKGAVEEGLKLQGVIERLNESLRNTGSYSGLSAAEIVELADKYEFLTGRTKEEEIAAALVLTRFKNLNEQAFPKALDLVNAYAHSLGITTEEAAKKLGPALDGNARSLRSLREAGVDLQPGQIKTLQTMIDTGHVAEYQAKLFAILTEKVGKAADIHETLGIQMGRAKDTLDEVKEGIASELIPALEDLTKDIVNQLGGWDSIKEKAAAFGHFIGDSLRQLVYGVIVLFHDLAASWDQVAIIIDRAIYSIAGAIRDFADAMSIVPGLGAAWTGVSIVMNKAMAASNESLMKDTLALYGHKAASDKAIDSYLAHRQALEGDTNAHKAHGSAQDDIANKQQKLNDLIGEGTKAIQSYTDKLIDLSDKLIEQSQSEIVLYTALQHGLEAYYRELLTQERRKAVLTEVTQLTKEHRTEIEKLQELVKKANDEQRYADAAKLKGMIDASNESFQKQIKAVGDLAGENFDLKHSTDSLLDATRSNLDYTGRQVEAWGQLTDALTGTTVSSRESAIQAEIQKRVLESLKNTQEDLTDSITETVRREHDFTNSMKDALDVAKELGKLNNEATLQTAISHIDSSLPQYLQKVEEQYLQIVAGIGKGSIEEGKRIIDATQKAFELFGIHIGNISALIKSNLEKIQDAQILKSISGASKTPYDIYKEERDNILRVMRESANDVSRTVEEKAQIERDGNAAILALNKAHYESILSNASGALDFLAQRFGGFFAQLKTLVDGLQQAQGFGNNVSGLVSGFGGSSQLAGAAGGVATVVGIFAVVYDFVDKMIKAHNLLKWGTATQIQVVGGNISSPSYFDQAGKKISDAIRKMLEEISNAIGGVLLDLPQVTIRARKDGKKFGAYVAGIWVGEFDSAQEAMEAGIAEAITKANFAGVSKEIIQALQASIGDTLDQIKDNINTAKFVRGARLGDTGESYIETIERDNQEIEAARRLGLATDDLVKKRDREAAAIKNQALGIDTTASDRLASIRSLSLGITEAAGSIEATLRQQIDSVMQQIAALENQARHPGVPGSSGGSSADGTGSGGFNAKGGGPLPEAPEDEALRHLREVLAQYMAELDKIPKALTDQEISMGIFDTLYQYLQSSPKYAAEAAKWAKVKVEIEFAQIKLQLELLGKWEEFAGMFSDAYNAALAAAGKTPHAGGKGGNDKQSVQSFIDDRRFQLQLAQMDQFHQQLAQIAKDYEAQLKAAGKDKKLREELLALQAQETAAAIKAHQQEIADQFASLINPSDAFAQAAKPFEDLKKQISDAGYGAARTSRMLERLTTAEEKAIEKLSMQQFSSLVGDLSNVIADSDTNTKQHLLHNDLLRAQEIINYQIKMIELRDEYIILKAKGDLTKSEIELLDKAFGWIDANANILPGGKDWIPSFEKVTTAADSLSNAAQNQNSAANDLKSAAESLIEYQTSLHTDSSLGLVNSREALDNSKALYEAIAAKALTGDIDAIKEFRTDAETYRKNLLAFSPSSALASNVLSGIDATIDKIKALPSVKAALTLTPDGQAIVTNLGYVATGITSVDTIARAINDNQMQTNQALTNTTPAAIADAMSTTMESQADKVAAAQEKNAQALLTLSEQFKGMSNNILAFRTESRTSDDEVFEQLKRAADTLETVAANTRPRRTRAGVGG